MTPITKEHEVVFAVLSDDVISIAKKDICVFSYKTNKVGETKLRIKKAKVIDANLIITNFSPQGETTLKIIEKKRPVSPGGNVGGIPSNTDSNNQPVVPILPPVKEEPKDEVEKIPEAVYFDDLDTVLWSLDAISYLNKKGIVDGMEGKKFFPNNFVTREQFVKMVVLGYSLKDLNADIEIFDVPKEHWSYDYVKIGLMNGIIKGQADAVFGLGNKMTREDCAVVIHRILGGDLATDRKAYEDFYDISDYAKESVLYLTEKNYQWYI